MAEEQDVIQKLDALLNKHRSSANQNADDIPVLTNIVEVDDERATQRPPSMDSLDDAGLSDTQIELLTREIFDHVMSKLGTQISNDLQVQLTERLSAIIDSTVAAAISDFKQGLADLIGDAIAEVLLDRAEKNSGLPPPPASPSH
jgi:hypothetical protein